jgi:hypothetical protein
MPKEIIKQLGIVGVDSGQIIITDPCYIGSEWKDNEYDQGEPGDYSYGGACQTADGEKLGGQLNFNIGHAGAGVVVRSGYGDGTYPVYALYNDEGRVSKLIVDFESMPGEKNRRIFETITKGKKTLTDHTQSNEFKKLIKLGLSCGLVLSEIIDDLPVWVGEKKKLDLYFKSAEDNNLL